MASSRLGLPPVRFPQFATDSGGLWPENPSLADLEGHAARQWRRGRAYPFSQAIKHPHLRLMACGIAQPARDHSVTLSPQGTPRSPTVVADFRSAPVAHCGSWGLGS